MCVYICMCIYMYICIYVHIYIYIYIVCSNTQCKKRTQIWKKARGVYGSIQREGKKGEWYNYIIISKSKIIEKSLFLFLRTLYFLTYIKLHLFLTFSVWPGVPEGHAKRNLLIFDSFMISNIYPALICCDTGSVLSTVVERWIWRDHSSLRETKPLNVAKCLQQNHEQNIPGAPKSGQLQSIP